MSKNDKVTYFATNKINVAPNGIKVNLDWFERSLLLAQHYEQFKSFELRTARSEDVIYNY